MRKAWQSLSRQMLLNRAPWIQVWIERVKLPGDVIIEDYFMVQMRSWVAVFAVTPDGRVPLVQQYRYGIDDTTLELPAGYIEPDEPPVISGQRELLEEVGCTAGTWEHMGSYTLIAPRGDMQVHVVMARDIENSGVQQLEETEDITIVWMTVEELRQAWRDNKIISAAHGQAIARGLDALGAW